MNTFTAIKLGIFLIIIGFGFLKWLYTKLQQQAEMKRSEELRRAMAEEALRTGRPLTGQRERDELEPVSALKSDPQQRLRELAMQRAEQLKRMRESTGAGAGSGRAQTASQMATRPGTGMQQPPRQPVARPVADVRRGGEMWPGGPVLAGGGGRATVQPPAPDKRAQQAEAQRRKAMAKQKQREQAQALARQQQQRQDLDEGQSARRRAAALSMAATSDAATAKESRRISDAAIDRSGDEFAGGMWTPEKIRSMYVLSEILSPPLALRQGSSGVGGFDGFEEGGQRRSGVISAALQSQPGV